MGDYNTSFLGWEYEWIIIVILCSIILLQSQSNERIKKELNHKKYELKHLKETLKKDDKEG